MVYDRDSLRKAKVGSICKLVSAWAQIGRYFPRKAKFRLNIELDCSAYTHTKIMGIEGVRDHCTTVESHMPMEKLHSTRGSGVHV